MGMNTSSSDKQKKYTGLIISIIIFLIIIISIFILSNVASREGQVNNEQINVSTHMRDSVQTISRDLFDIGLMNQEKITDNLSERKTKKIQQIVNNSKFLSSALYAFDKGGSVVLPDETVDIPKATDPEIIKVLSGIIDKWNTFKPIIDNYTKKQVSPAYRKNNLNTAIASARDIGQVIYIELDEMAELVHEQTHKRAFLLESIQIIGIGIAIIYFIIFVFFFVRRLRNADREIAEARKETTEIMQTIHEGLFLIDQNLRIGKQTSDKLSEIIPKQKFSGQNLETLLETLIDKKNIENTRRFIKQLFNERIDEQLIEGLNPLQRIPIRFEREDRLELRYLHFTFNRVWEDEVIKRVLVSVTDISDAVELEENLTKERKQNEQQTELLVKILQISPQLLAGFLRNTHRLTQQINTILKRPDRNITDLKNKAQEIFRDVHSFKGEALALGLDHFVDSCEEIENHLKNLQNNDKIIGNDFMPITIALDDLIERLKTIENLQINIQQISDNTVESDNLGDIKQYYRRFANEVAARNDKSVNLTIKEYHFEKMDDKTHDQVKEIIIQLIRNAIVHGIESSRIRESLDKSPTGQLIMTLKEKDDAYILDFTDDGAGINYLELREKAKQSPQYASHPEVIDQMTQKELNRLIFMSGLSTAKQSNKDAGRGMGMDVIKNRLTGLGAKIALRSKPEAGTEFIIRIPRKLSGV